MNISPKERFLGICRFEKSGDLYYSDEFQDETPDQWVKQGAPEQILDAGFCDDYFKFTRRGHSLVEIKSGLAALERNIDFGHGVVVRSGWLPLIPNFEPRIIEDDERTITYFNRIGQTARAWKAKRYGMPMYLDWPVKDRASWEEYKKRLDPNTPERWPADWDAYVKDKNKLGEEYPIQLDVVGFIMSIREMVGTERMLYMFYDDPGLIEDMMEQILYFQTEIIKRVIKDIRPDCLFLGEDMAWRGGPLISPDMVRKFMMPRYKKMTDLLHKSGTDIIYMDSDGNVNKLIPLWLESGINYVWPLEVAAGNDAVAIRKKYGKDLIIGGTIDKRALAKDKKAIREEVMSKVPFLLEQGGYFPSVDHLVPPDVTFENYCYYINLMREVAGLEKLSF